MENTVAAQWKTLLAEEGYRPVLEVNEENTSECRLRFKADGKRFQAFFDHDDPTFAHVQLAYDVEGFALALLVRVANDINETLKGVKATVDANADVVRLNMEWFLEGIPSAPLLERTLSQLSKAASEFFEKLGAVEPVKALA